MSNIWSLTLFLTQSSEIPWNFLGDRNIFCSNEVTLGGLLVGGWSSEKPSHDQKPGIFSPTSQPPERGEGLEME